MEYDIDTIMNRLGQMDPKILEDALRSLSKEVGKKRVADHVACAMDRNLTVDGPQIRKYVAERLSGLGESDIVGLAKDYDMDTPEGIKEIASQLITEDVVDCFADVLVDLVSIGRDSDVKECVMAIASAIRETECPLTALAGDYSKTYPDFLIKCLEEGDPLRAFIEEE